MGVMSLVYHAECDRTSVDFTDGSFAAKRVFCAAHDAFVLSKNRRKW